MDVSSINKLNNGLKEITKVNTNLFQTSEAAAIDNNRNTTFESMFQSALSMIKETNNLTNQAQEAEMSYAMGTMTSTHDLQIAQQKANISLQYTVAVRNAVLDAYKEIMQLQF